MNWWGVPDWRDGDAYEAELSMAQWRWEFLRRREDYRVDWALHFEPSFRRNAEAFRGLPVPSGVASWDDHFSAIAEMPGCREKYGTAYLLDPSLKAPNPGLFVVQAPYGVRYASEETFDKNEAGGQKLMAFDLRRPLPEQLRKAKDYLERLQAELHGKPDGKRAHIGKWPTYLRVLDARDAGETFEAIGTALFDDLGGSEAAAKAYQVWDAARLLMFKPPA